MILKLAISVSVAPGVSYASRYLLADQDGGQGGHCQMDGLVYEFHSPCCSALHSLTKAVSRNQYPSDDIKSSHQNYGGTSRTLWDK
jgi:hypothetical protein